MSRAGETYPEEVRKAEKILHKWTFDAIDSPAGAARTFIRVLKAIGIFDLSELRWQIRDADGLALWSLDTPMPTISIVRALQTRLS
jgi:hypothetical protein